MKPKARRLFTQREVDIARLIVDGCGVEDVCSRLNLRKSAVAEHWKKFMKFTGARSAEELRPILRMELQICEANKKYRGSK